MERSKGKKDDPGDDQGDSTSSEDTQSETEETNSEIAASRKREYDKPNRKSEKVATAPYRTLGLPLAQSKKRESKTDAMRNTSLPDEVGSAPPGSWLNRSLEEQVLFAGTIVAQTLYDGPWPSPVMEETADDLEKDSTDDMTRHKAHMSMIGASLRKFCQDTILKTMSSAMNSHSVRKKGASLDERPFLGTLLMIREVLAQNYFTIFGSNGIRREEKGEINDTGLVAFASRAMATSVILCAIQEHPRTETLTNVFLDKANAYDESRGSFTDLLSPYIDDKEESEVANIQDDSFALNACKHPLVANQRSRTTAKRRKDNESSVLCLPEPNAVHITILRPTCCE